MRRSAKTYRRRNIFLVALLIITFMMVILGSQFYRVKTKVAISNHHKSLLINLGKEALKTNDIPVAAILIYKDSIIGTGYNTVKLKGNLSGHAEINALNMAYKNYGEAFFDLDRTHLTLISTFEPCSMCKGALIEYDIQNVLFERPKTLKHQLRNQMLEWKYHLNIKRIDAEGLQESLFKLHPSYDKKNEY